MFKFLGKMNIASRISLALIIPVIGLLLFSSVLLHERKQVATEVSQLQKLATLSPVVSAVVHELQKERGMSAGYIGTKGLDFADRLPQQRHLAEQKKKDLLVVLDRFDAGAFGAGLQGKVQASRTKLSLLDDERKDVDALKSTVAKMADYYTITIANLLSIVDESAALSTHVQITNAIEAYSSILQLKERAGLERAMGSAGFGRLFFRPAIHKRFVELIAEQKVFLDSFNTHATPDQKTYFTQTVLGPKVDEVARMRQIAIDSPISGTTEDVESTYWFDTITVKINLLQVVENRLADDLMAQAGQIKQKAWTVFWITAGVVVAGLLITTVILFIIMRSITRPLNCITNVMKRLAGGDRNIEIETSDGHDEISSLGRAAESFRRNMVEADMNNILSISQMMDSDQNMPAEYMNIVFKASSRLLDLVNEVKEVARLETDKTAEPLRIVSPAAVVGDCLSRLSPLAETCTVRFVDELSGNDNIADVQSYGNKFESVLLGLFSTAIENAQQGGVITVSADTEGANMRIIVRDDGPGIAESAIVDLFDPMLSISSIDVDGAGLGLALVQKTIEAMQGSLGVESKLGKNTIYWVKLPVASSGAKN